MRKRSRPAKASVIRLVVLVASYGLTVAGVQRMSQGSECMHVACEDKSFVIVTSGIATVPPLEMDVSNSARLNSECVPPTRTDNHLCSAWQLGPSSGESRRPVQLVMMESEAEYFTFLGAGQDTLAARSSLPLDSSDPRRMKAVILIHGFSGSSDYFKHNFDALGSRFWVVAPDLRGHGRSSKTPGRHHVACLAKDLQCLVGHLRASLKVEFQDRFKVVPVGC